MTQEPTTLASGIRKTGGPLEMCPVERSTTEYLGRRRHTKIGVLSKSTRETFLSILSTAALGLQLRTARTSVYMGVCDDAFSCTDASITEKGRVFYWGIWQRFVLVYKPIRSSLVQRGAKCTCMYIQTRQD